MQLVQEGKRWEAISAYGEWEAKEAGFRWDPSKRRWWTDSKDKAARLAAFAVSPQLKTELETHADAQAGEANAAREASRATDADIAIPAPDGLEYMPFQRAGIAYALGRPATLNCDQMGLGKTIQAIGVINGDPSVQKVLVVCPASLRINWRRELEKWLVRPLTIGIATSARLPQTDVVIVNYDILHRHTVQLRWAEWDILIADECHFIKNQKARRTIQVLGKWNIDDAKRVDPIPARRRLFLTGTPDRQPTGGTSPPSCARSTVRSGGDWRQYVTRYCAGVQTEYGWDVSGASHLDELQDRLRATCMVRRLKADVLTDLPAKRRQVIELPENGCTSAIRAEAASIGTRKRPAPGSSCSPSRWRKPATTPRITRSRWRPYAKACRLTSPRSPGCA